MRTAASVILAAVLAAAAARAEVPALVAVLPLDVTHAGLDPATRMALEEDIRSIAGDALAPLGYTVLTGDNTLRVLADNGISAERACDSTCALDAARELKARLFVSGSVARTEGQYVAFVRLFEPVHGQQLGFVRMEGDKIRNLRQQFEAKASKLFEKAPRNFAAAPPVVPAPAPQPVVPAPAPQPVVPAPAPQPSREAAAAPVDPPPSAPQADLGEGVDATKWIFLEQGGLAISKHAEGLVWQRRAPAQSMTWDEATSYCASLELHGGGWRLPHNGDIEAAHNGAFPDPGLPHGERLWTQSNDSVIGKLSDERVAMEWTSYGGYAFEKTEKNRVRCVRGENDWDWHYAPIERFAVRAGAGGGLGRAGLGLEWIMSDMNRWSPWQTSLRLGLGSGLSLATAALTLAPNSFRSGFYVSLFGGLAKRGPLGTALLDSPDPGGVLVGAAGGFELAFAPVVLRLGLGASVTFADGAGLAALPDVSLGYFF